MTKFTAAVLYATQTGVSKTLAERTASLLDSKFLKIEIHSFDDVPNPSFLQQFRCLIFICSSTGQGDPPDNAGRFYRHLRRLSNSESAVFANSRYTLLGLGDSNYQTFGAFPKSLNKLVLKLGATPFYDFQLADDAVGLDAVVEPFIEGLPAALCKELGVPLSQLGFEGSEFCLRKDISMSGILVDPVKIVPPDKGFKLPNLPSPALKICFEGEALRTDADEFSKAYYQSQTYFGSSSPVALLQIKEANTLTSPSALKPVHEICFDGAVLPTTESLLPGDSFSLLCVNDETEVDQILERLHLTETANIPMTTTGSKIPTHLRSEGIPWTLRNCLLVCLDLRSPPKKSFLRLMAVTCSNEKERNELQYLSSFEGSSDFAALIREAQLSILDLLLLFPSISITGANLVENLPPLKPRSYSLANDPTVTQELRFAFSEVFLPQMDSHRQYDRHGVCTNFLLNAMSSFKKDPKVLLPVFTRTTQPFRLPQDTSVPLVLISAGTGLAPYISFFEFLARQKLLGADIHPDIWLFHGCRNREHDFIYREKIEEWANQGLITKLAMACSRQDPPQHDGSRTYVQHKLLESGELLMNMVPPAVIFACGDGARMAPSLRETLVTLIVGHLNVSREEALAVFKQWLRSGRYKEDVWR